MRKKLIVQRIRGCLRKSFQWIYHKCLGNFILIILYQDWLVVPSYWLDGYSARCLQWGRQRSYSVKFKVGLAHPAHAFNGAAIVIYCSKWQWILHIQILVFMIPVYTFVRKWQPITLYVYELPPRRSYI